MIDVLTGRSEPKGCQYATGIRGGACGQHGRWYWIQLDAARTLHAFRCPDHLPLGSGPNGEWKVGEVLP